MRVMGVISKRSERNTAGSSRNRLRDVPVALFKKTMLLIVMVFGFAIYNQAFIPSVQPKTQYLNQALTGNMGFLRALKMTAWQGLEFGTKNVFMFLDNIVTYLNNAQPVEAIFLAGFPLFIIFIIWLIPVTMVFDIMDQRKRKETNYFVQVVVALLVMLFASSMINGFYMFSDMRENQQCDELYEFQQENETYLNCLIGEINNTVTPDMYEGYSLENDTWIREMSGGNEPDIVNKSRGMIQ